MVEQQFNDSSYRFTEPVRYFKANDPYYFEVDNIPIKQLEENCLWLRDQLTQTQEVAESGITSVKRGDIDELKPYSTGADRLVRVKPGRFSARINDIAGKDPLQHVTKILGSLLGDNEVLEFGVNDTENEANTALGQALDKFKSTSFPLFMTGLEERTFTWPVVNHDTPVGGDGTQGDFTDAINYAQAPSPGTAANRVPAVISQALQWVTPFQNGAESYILPLYEFANESTGHVKLPTVESNLIKMWRGVTRFSIVDVPEELSIEVPAFDSDDFDYIGQGSPDNNQDVNGVVTRIDLIFLYAKPIDTSGVRLVKNNEITTLTKPALGLIRGAGLKYNESKFVVDTGPVPNPNVELLPESAYDAEGNPTILAGPGDQFADNTGFTAASGNDIVEDVKGSFPAPDDLLNIAPLLSEKLQDEALELIGQSILPVAYVVVRDSGDPLINGAQLVSVNDVIDIRPFFRTAELTYNERAGIAGAIPQLSLANPAVGKAQMDKELYDMKNYVDSKTDFEIPDQINPIDQFAVLATGYVWGGYNFGPEGALWGFHKQDFADQGVDQDQATKTFVRDTYYGFAGEQEFTIPDYPDWDLASWCILNPDLQNKGQFPNDYINTFAATQAAIVAGSFSQQVQPDGDGPTPGVEPNRWSNIDGITAPASTDYFTATLGAFSFMKKTIFFNRDSVGFMEDYSIDVQLVNCVPQIDTGSFQNKYGGTQYPARWAGVWVEKGLDFFTIYVAYPGSNPAHYPNYPLLDRSSNSFSSFLVGVDRVVDSDPTSFGGTMGFTGNPRFGRCTYPTVFWKMTSVPAIKSEFHNTQGGQENANIFAG